MEKGFRISGASIHAGIRTGSSPDKKFSALDRLENQFLDQSQHRRSFHLPSARWLLSLFKHSMRFHHLFFGGLLSAQSCLAAHVQSKNCRETVPKEGKDGASSWISGGLDAAIAPGAYDLPRLELIISGRQPDWESCEDAGKPKFASFVEVESLGGTDKVEGKLDNLTCRDSRPWGPWVSFYFSYDINPPQPLDAFSVSVDLRNEDDAQIGCVNAPVTPYMGHSMSQALTWCPIVIFALVVFVALWGETRALSSFSEQDFDNGRPEREQSRAHVTRVADYISYLQFIFFSGALTLQYPGFLQPVASRASWSTLMLPAGMVAPESWYTGVKDGIYEVNGTFTGTPGMEIMSQVVGGTVTMDTWLNMLALAAGVLVLLILIVGLGQRLTWTRDWFQGESSMAFNAESRFSVRATMWTALRLFCSYLLLPIVAWTTYQLDHASILPVYHTVAATAIITITILIMWWAMSQSNPRHLGYLLVDDAIKEDQQNTQRFARTDNLYAAGVFLLLFLRGSTIGGLQFVGMVQFLVLLATEIIQVSLHALVFPQAFLFSRARIMPAIKMTVLVLMAPFLPDTAGHAAKLGLGVVIVIIHALVLLGIFLVPAILDVYNFGRNTASRLLSSDGGSLRDLDSPQIYGLRDLRRRPTNPTAAVLSEMGSSIRSISPLPPALSSSSPEPPLSPSNDRASYFRQPRRNQSIATFSRISNSTFNRADSPSSAEASDSGYRGSHEEESDSSAEATLCEPSPVDPTVDYSIREADLYYGRPRRLSFGEAAPEPERKVKSRISSVTSRLKLR